MGVDVANTCHLTIKQNQKSFSEILKYTKPKTNKKFKE